ncbi:uncharacterized protein [Aristolochia californica]|uniref:uncharacterized protein n=1 Tax=Aristolochia californica TaxID=171875 RepID=UPI0035DE9070
MVDATSGGSLMGKSDSEVWDFFETLSDQSQQWVHLIPHKCVHLVHPTRSSLRTLNVVQNFPRPNRNDPFSETDNPNWARYQKFLMVQGPTGWGSPRNTQSSIVKLEMQVSQLTSHMSEQAQIRLPSQTIPNPKSTHETIRFGALKPTPITLQLADLNVTNQIPVILGCPFLSTSNAVIHCKSGELELSFGNFKVSLNVFNVEHHPLEYDDLSPAFKIETYAFLGPMNSLLVIIASDLSTEQKEQLIERSLWITFLYLALALRYFCTIFPSYCRIALSPI